MRFSLLLFCLLLGFSGAVQAKRIALVIGNDAYPNLPPRYQLQKAKNDARSTAETFKALGFKVIEGFDLKRRAMNVKLSSFANSIEPGDEVMFFFAGHGVRIEGLNYLLPSDIPAIDGASEDLLKSESLRVDEITDRFRKKGARLSILVLDACRNNPYETSNGRSLGGTRGLAAMDPPEGTLVLFSAGAGQQALDRLSDDDTNPNSVFTRVFLPLVRKEGLELSRLSRQVKAKVRDLARSINHKQTPAVYNEVIGDVFLSGRSVEASSRTENSVVKSASDLLWNSIEHSKKASDFEFYLSEHPNERHSSVAKLKLQQMAALKVPEKPQTEKLAEPVLHHLPRPGQNMRVCHEHSFDGQRGRLCVSSILSPQYGNRYGSINLSDSRMQTAWVEGARGDGIGETLLLSFSSEREVNEISLANGYNKNRDIYRKNGRVREFIVRSSTGFEQSVKVKDTGKWQVLDLPPLGKVTWVSLSISKVYRGRKYRDTAISELRIK